MLKNKKILITGSSRGIGASIARLASGYGAEVVLHGKTESPDLIALASELNVGYFFCDIADGAQVQEQIEKIGVVDVLINNAGVSISKPFLDLTSKDWEDTLEQRARELKKIKELEDKYGIKMKQTKNISQNDKQKNKESDNGQPPEEKSAPATE